MHPTNDEESAYLPLKTQREPFVPLALVMLAPLLMWAAHFAMVYLLEGFLCTRPVLSPQAIPVGVLVATLMFGGACAWTLFAGPSLLRRAGVAPLQSQRFLIETQRVFAGLSLVAIVWSGAGALFLGPCAFAY